MFLEILCMKGRDNWTGNGLGIVPEGEQTVIESRSISVIIVVYTILIVVSLVCITGFGSSYE